MFTPSLMLLSKSSSTTSRDPDLNRRERREQRIPSPFPLFAPVVYVLGVARCIGREATPARAPVNRHFAERVMPAASGHCLRTASRPRLVAAAHAGRRPSQFDEKSLCPSPGLSRLLVPKQPPALDDLDDRRRHQFLPARIAGLNLGEQIARADRQQ